MKLAITIIVDVHDEAPVVAMHQVHEALASAALRLDCVRAVIGKSSVRIPGPVCRPLAKAGAR